MVIIAHRRLKGAMQRRSWSPPNGRRFLILEDNPGGIDIVFDLAAQHDRIHSIREAEPCILNRQEDARVCIRPDDGEYQSRKWPGSKYIDVGLRRLGWREKTRIKSPTGNKNSIGVVQKGLDFIIRVNFGVQPAGFQ